MRINVMEFGRFTASRYREIRNVSGERPEHSLIMLHREGERNHGECNSRVGSEPWLAGHGHGPATLSRPRPLPNFYGLAAVGFGCLAMIWSLILS